MIRQKFLIIILDICVALFSLTLAYVVRFGDVASLQVLWGRETLSIFFYLLTLVFVSYFFDLYNYQKFNNFKYILQRSTISAITSFFVLSAMFYMLPGLRFWRGVLVLLIVFNALGQIGLRMLLQKFLRASIFAQRILVIGAGDLARTIAAIIPLDDNIHSYVRFVACTDNKPLVDPALIVGHIKDLGDILQDYRPQKLILSLAERRGNLPLREIMHSKLRGIEVLDATTFFEQIKGCLMIENMQPSSFVYTHRFRMTPFMRSYKRLFDVVLSVIGLFVAAPLFPLVALAVKIDSPGPIFFKQLRVGEREVEYFVYKFRTMAENAESKTGAVWAQKNDPRVTRIGRFLRKTRLDEIPQLFNVLKGDMSFIGPRPERMAFVERLKETIPFYSTRHFVKPGVTGWAQVCYPYGASDEDALEKLRYDLYYIKNYSILLDFKIILETIRVVTSGFGGR